VRLTTTTCRRDAAWWARDDALPATFRQTRYPLFAGCVLAGRFPFRALRCLPLTTLWDAACLCCLPFAHAYYMDSSQFFGCGQSPSRSTDSGGQPYHTFPSASTSLSSTRGCIRAAAALFFLQPPAAKAAFFTDCGGGWLVHGGREPGRYHSARSPVSLPPTLPRYMPCYFRSAGRLVLPFMRCNVVNGAVRHRCVAFAFNTSAFWLALRHGFLWDALDLYALRGR